MRSLVHGPVKNGLTSSFIAATFPAQEYQASSISGGRGIVDAGVPETRTSAATRSGVGDCEVKPVARNSAAIRFVHGHGFDPIGQIELILDLARPERRRPGERLAGRDFRV